MSLRPVRPATLLVGSTLAAVLASAGGMAGATPSPPVRAAVAQDATSGSPDARAVGHWTVTPSGRGSYVVTWSSPTPLPTTDARPQIVGEGAAPAGSTAVSPDGRSVSTTVRSKTRPDPSDFDVELSGRVLDETGQPTSGPAAPYAPQGGVKQLGIDPAAPGRHDIQSHDYRLAPRTLPDIPLRSEMVAHVVEPTDATDASPLVLFLHGRHAPCYKPAAGASASSATALSRAVAEAAKGDWKCPGKQRPIPSYLGYDYVQQRLARQGYVTVSISADAINALDYAAADGGAGARAALIEAHLDVWARLVERGREHADVDNVILVGHSRGGEGANRASVDISPQADYTVTGQILIGPTDFGFQSAPEVPTVTILPYCDGDVSDLQGQNFVDDARDLTDGPLAFHSSLLVMGANHNFFNSEWTPGISVAPSNDDWYGNPKQTCGTETDERLTPLEQRKVGSSYIAAATHLFARDDQDVLPLFDGSQVSLASADDADVRSHAIGGGFGLRRPRLDTTLSPTHGAETRFCVGESDARRAQVCEPHVSSGRTPHWAASYFAGVPLRPEFDMRWTAAGQVGGMMLKEPWDLSGDRLLLLRTIVQPPRPANLQVILTDADGRSVTLDHLGSRLHALPGRQYSLAKRWAQTLQVSLAHPGRVDLANVTQVDLRSVNQTGHVWVLDLSAEPRTGITAAPRDGFPTISLGEVRQDEGDGPGTSTVRIPYTIRGPLAADATITVVSAQQFSGEIGKPQRVVIPAGTRRGSFPLTYDANTTDDPERRRMLLAAYAVHGIQTDRYLGQVTIVDDDPDPEVAVTVRSYRIAEGSRARWNISLSAPMSYDSQVRAVVLGTGDRAELTVGDLPKKFRHRHLFPVPPLDTPLSESDLYLYAELPEGETAAHFSLPTLSDDTDEGARTVRLRFRVYGIKHKPTSGVVVTDGARGDVVPR